MPRKTIAVNEDVHARFSEMWKKTPSWLHGYGDSASDVLRYLMDFYEQHKTKEMDMALQLVRAIEKRLEANQVDIYGAIRKAREIDEGVRT